MESVPSISSYLKYNVKFAYIVEPLSGLNTLLIFAGSRVALSSSLHVLHTAFGVGKLRHLLKAVFSLHTQQPVAKIYKFGSIFTLVVLIVDKQCHKFKKKLSKSL